MIIRQSNVILLHPSETPPPDAVTALAAHAAESADPGALLERAWRDGDLAGLRLAYAHGERHDLWWEFTLVRSLEASARDWDLAPYLFRWRMHRLARELSLEHLVNERVLDLSPSERARANLAAALLRRPDVLLWEDPFVAMSPEDQVAASRLVDSLIGSEGLIVLAAGSLEAL